jgi:hypothetical protein
MLCMLCWATINWHTKNAKGFLLSKIYNRYSNHSQAQIYYSKFLLKIKQRWGTGASSQCLHTQNHYKENCTLTTFKQLWYNHINFINTPNDTKLRVIIRIESTCSSLWFSGEIHHSTLVIFKIQKRIIQILPKSKSRDSCRQLFKRLEILPLQSQYIFSILLFVVKNKELYTTNQEIHDINTRSITNLHLPVCNLTLFQKAAYCSGIKLFNHLPQKIKSLSNVIKLFKPALKRFLNLHSFYSVEEYFEYSYN